MGVQYGSHGGAQGGDGMRRGGQVQDGGRGGAQGGDSGGDGMGVGGAAPRWWPGGFRWVWMGSVGSGWVLLGLCGFCWVQMGSIESGWVPLGLDGFHWVRLGSVGSGWVLLDLVGFHWVQMASGGSGWLPLHPAVFRWVPLALWVAQPHLWGAAPPDPPRIPHRALQLLRGGREVGPGGRQHPQGALGGAEGHRAAVPVPHHLPHQRGGTRGGSSTPLTPLWGPQPHPVPTDPIMGSSTPSCPH